VKEARVQKYKNAMLEVEKHVNQVRLGALMTPFFARVDVLASLQASARAVVEDFRSTLLQHCHLEVLAEGNLTVDEAVTLSECATH
jgi:secreted Zn-dependent insulinase-like peptidase